MTAVPLTETTTGTQQLQSFAAVRRPSRSPTPRAPATLVEMVGPAQMTGPRFFPNQTPVSPTSLTLEACSDGDDLGGPAGAPVANAADGCFFWSVRRPVVRRLRVRMHFEVSAGLVASSIGTAMGERFFVRRCPAATDTLCVPGAFGSLGASRPSNECLACRSALHLSGGDEGHIGIGSGTGVPPTTPALARAGQSVLRHIPSAPSPVRGAALLHTAPRSVTTWPLYSNTSLANPRRRSLEAICSGCTATPRRAARRRDRRDCSRLQPPGRDGLWRAASSCSPGRRICGSRW